MAARHAGRWHDCDECGAAYVCWDDDCDPDAPQWCADCWHTWADTAP